VLMKRPRVTPDNNDVQFERGKFIPVAVNAWDGSNGEHGLIMSLSSWYYVTLEAPATAAPFIYGGLAVLLSGFFGVWITRRTQVLPRAR